jgi:hypothetical protein
MLNGERSLQMAAIAQRIKVAARKRQALQVLKQQKTFLHHLGLLFPLQADDLQHQKVQQLIRQASALQQLSRLPRPLLRILHLLHLLHLSLLPHHLNLLLR